MNRLQVCSSIFALLISFLLLGCRGGETAISAPTLTPPPPPTSAPALATVLPQPTSLPPTEQPTGLVRYTYRVINSYPHDPAAFTQGLVFDNGILYEGTGLYGQSTLRRVVLETGDVQQSISISPELFGEGVTLFGNRLFQLTWQGQVAFVWDAETLAPLGSFPYTTEGWGITHDGTQLIMSDGTPTIYFRDPETFAEIGRITVQENGQPVRRLNELEFFNGEIFANVWQTNEIVRIDPSTGNVLGRIDLTGLLSAEEQAQLQDPSNDVLNGIAWDAENGRLFVTGKRWPRLFEIELIITE